MRALLTIAISIALLGTFTQTANADGDFDGGRQLRPKACGIRMERRSSMSAS